MPGQRLAAAFDSLVRAASCAVALTAASMIGCQARAADAVGPTVRDVVEFTRIVPATTGAAVPTQPYVSPDGTSAFIVTRRANVGADRNRYQFLLLDLRPDALAAGRPRPPVVLATINPVLDQNAAYPALQEPRWVGQRTIVFRTRIDEPVFQVYKVDTVSRRLTQLTHSPTGVVSFGISQDLRRIVYAAQQDNPPLAPGKRSVVVGNQSFWSVKFGQHDMRAQLRRYQYFVAEAGSRRPARVLGEAFNDGTTPAPPASISPDGRWALLPRIEAERHLAWAKTYPLLAAASDPRALEAGTDPLGYFARTSRYVPRRLVAYRLADGQAQATVDAPDDADGMPRIDAVWQGTGTSVVIAGTHLPADAIGEGGLGRGSHVIEYWPDSGRWKAIAELQGRRVSARGLPARPDAFEVVDQSGRRVFERVDGGWRELRGAAPAATAPTGWTLQFKEDLDVPPDAVAQGPAGQTVRLTDLNPQFSRAWGTVRPYAWKDAKDREWQGALLLPANYDPGVRHAMVIQSYGFAPGRFYLDGSNQSIGHTSGFAGRAFLRENLLVLAFPVQPSTNAPRDEAGRIAAFMDGVRGAIDALVAEGVVDRDRIGIMGWSMTGENVLNQVTFSDAPIRAATILDGDANTVFSLAVTHGYSDGITARKGRANQGLPFGDTLAAWVRNDPALHTDCIKAALRIETYGPWVLNNWDIYALMRSQYKPVEMVVIPNGSHGLMTPSERMLSLQGNVDWFRFWLQGQERSVPLLAGEDAAALGAQYRRWRELAELKRADDARPACARQGG
jgi:dipeptidyl aminopeptidase/acylaminoacyl peptidase